MMKRWMKVMMRVTLVDKITVEFRRLTITRMRGIFNNRSRFKRRLTFKLD